MVLHATWHPPYRPFAFDSAANAIAAAHNDVARLRALHDNLVVMSETQLAQAEVRGSCEAANH